MQTPEARPARQGVPPDAVAPARPFSPRWHRAYFVLAAFVVFTVCGSLVLNGLLMDIYVDAVAENAEWAEWLHVSAELGEFAAQMNAPGNDVFASGDVSAQSARLQAARLEFERHLAGASSEVRRHLDPERADPFLADLEAVSRHGEQIAEEAERIFEHIRLGHRERAGRRMADMDQQFAAVLASLYRFHAKVAAVQRELFDAELDRAAAIRRFQYGVAGLVVLMVVGLAVYGQSIRRQVRSHELEREEHARALRASEARLRGVFDSAVDTVITIDAAGVIESANQSLSEAFGYEPHEVIGQNIRMLMPEPYQSEHDGYLAHYRETGESRIIGIAREVVARGKDGAVFPVDLTVGEIDLGDRVVFTGVLRDVSEKQRMEVQLRQAQKLESIGQLAAGIAHEINTPIQFVGDNLQFLQDSFDELSKLNKSYAQLFHASRGSNIPEQILAEVAAAEEEADLEYLDEEIPSAIRQGREGAERVRNIVLAMKQFSHPGSTSKKAINLNRAIESTVTVSRNEWKYAADLTTELDPDLPEVTCLAAEINQVILNLIVNAAHSITDVLEDSSEEKGAITIRTRRVDDDVEIKICDTGGGIPESAQEHIFDPFFTTKEVGKGTGQGLAIARAVIVEKHGGGLDFESELGKGTTFRIRLPIEPRGEASAGSC